MTREEISLICKAMSDPNRLRIIELLTTGEKCGCQLLDELQVTQPTLSHHMKVLAECGLVSSRRDGKWQHYSVSCERVKEFREHLSTIISCKLDAENEDHKPCGCQERKNGGAEPNLGGVTEHEEHKPCGCKQHS